MSPTYIQTIGVTAESAWSRMIAALADAACDDEHGTDAEHPVRWCIAPVQSNEQANADARDGHVEDAADDGGEVIDMRVDEEQLGAFDSG